MVSDKNLSITIPVRVTTTVSVQTYKRKRAWHDSGWRCQTRRPIRLVISALQRLADTLDPPRRHPRGSLTRDFPQC